MSHNQRFLKHNFAANRRRHSDASIQQMAATEPASIKRQPVIVSFYFWYSKKCCCWFETLRHVCLHLFLSNHFPPKLHVTVYTSSSQRPCHFSSLDAADNVHQLTAQFASLAVVEGLHFRPIRRRTKSVQVVVFFLFFLSALLQQPFLRKRSESNNIC